MSAAWVAGQRTVHVPHGGRAADAKAQERQNSLFTDVRFRNRFRRRWFRRVNILKGLPVIFEFERRQIQILLEIDILCFLQDPFVGNCRSKM